MHELHEQISDGTITRKGEFVVVVGGSLETQTSSVEVDRLLVELADILPGKEAAKAIARATGEKRNALYRRLLELTEGKNDA